MNPLRQAQENNFQKSQKVELHAQPDSQQRKSVSDSPIEPMPRGVNRIEALKDLGATFEEGNHEVAKIATPIGETPVPSFIDSQQVDLLARGQKSKSIHDIAKEAVAE
ncbi:hypothetical protein BC943DRAFT_65426 [Umbelopsis sp. AD052]|nr:hypothetical protein BC943DRAFT_65426 [Umbelopsis sp. AD052]